MGTGLIFAAIVLVWAFFLVPLALRRYDETMHTHSVDTFSSALRVLRRRGSSPGRAYASAVSASSDRAAPADQPDIVADPEISVTARPSTRRAVRRRRRTLLVLLMLTVLVAGVAIYGALPIWSPVLPAVLVVTWLVACRRQVLGERSRRTPMTAPVSPPVVASPTPEPVLVETVQADESLAAPIEEPLDPAGDEETVEIPAVRRAAATPESAAGQSLWDPVPVTLPTYVDKPRAARTIRTIDFAEPGTWSSGRDSAQRPPVAGEHSDQPVHRRAVGD